MENSEKKISKNSILIREFNKHFERKTMLEIEIALQKQLDQEEMSAKKPINFDRNGNPISYREIKRKEHVEILEENLEKVDLIIKTIQSL